ncbi:MAG TPA: acyltransferase domain-containing protein [Symbiobacteriaceae bacterium]|jgi:[acyl-carrier-protein] S-malonyltransferase
MEKIACLFPGQGSHFVGMGRSLCDQHEIARHTFEEANDVLGYNLAKVCFEGGVGELSRADNAWTGLVTLSVALFRVYMKQIGLAPQFCAGHSLGEYSALICAGGIRFPDGLRIVHLRGKLAEAIAVTDTGAMTVVDGIDPRAVEAECARVSAEEQHVAVSCYNSPTQTDISGYRDAVLKVEERILDLGGQVTPLYGSAPMHSSLMEEAVLKLSEALQQCSFGYIRYPVVSNVAAHLYQGPGSLAETLVQHLVRPVLWQHSIDFLKRHGVTLFVEMGAKNVLSNLISGSGDDVRALCFGVREDRAELQVGREPAKASPSVVSRCLAMGAALPNRNWDQASFQEGVLNPYRRIQDLQARLDREGRAPSLPEMKDALELLRLIMQTKRLPAEEQQESFNLIFEETGTQYLFKDFVAKRQTV